MERVESSDIMSVGFLPFIVRRNINHNNRHEKSISFKI